jgi:hypothetical protein
LGGRPNVTAETRDIQEGTPVLAAIKLLHTVVWAFFVGCIAGIFVFSFTGRLGLALAFIAVVLIEVLVLAFNGLRCPLTGVAARFTDERSDNFDIYLPEWLARNNKMIFGTLYFAGIGYTLLRWLR